MIEKVDIYIIITEQMIEMHFLDANFSYLLTNINNKIMVNKNIFQMLLMFIYPFFLY